MNVGKLSEKRVAPSNKFSPHHVKDLVGEYGTRKRDTQQGVPVVPEENTNDKDYRKKDKGMPDCPAAAQNVGKYHGKRFVEQIGDDCTKDTDGKCPAVIRQVPERKTNQGTAKDVGEDEHVPDRCGVRYLNRGFCLNLNYWITKSGFRNFSLFDHQRI